MGASLARGASSTVLTDRNWGIWANMSNGGVWADPYANKELWSEAKARLTNADKAGTNPLTKQEMAELEQIALKSGGEIDADERALLKKLSVEGNAQTLLAFVEQHPDETPGILKIEPLSDQEDAMLDARYDAMGKARKQEMAAAQFAVDYAPLAEVDRDALRAKLFPLTFDLGNPGDCDALLTDFSQLLLFPEDDKKAQWACVPTTLVAMAVRAGPDGIKGVCEAILKEHTDAECPMAAALLARLKSGDGTVSMQEMTYLAEELYRVMKESDAATSPGLRNDKIIEFLSANKACLAPLFEDGSRLLILDTDNKDGTNHAAALLGNGEAVFDPGHRRDGVHLLDNDDLMKPYAHSDHFMLTPW